MGRADDAGRGRRTRTSTGSAHALNPRLRRPAGAASLTPPAAARSAFARGARRPATVAAAGGRSARRALSGRGPVAWAAALALLAAFALAAPVQAQTSISLVTNHGQSSASGVFGFDWFTTFTTGSYRGDYKLTSVDLVLGSVAGKTGWNVEVRSLDTSGNPDSLVGTLAGPGTAVTGTNTYTASGTGLDLKANTTYAVVLDVTASVTAQVFQTTSNSEDSGALLGWSIGDESGRRAWNTSSWPTTITSGNPMKLAIKGYAKDATTPTVDLVRVVSAPTHDSDSDGQFDTYVRRDNILFDVEYSEPVVVA